MIELRGVSVLRPDGREMLGPVDCTIEDGAWVALAGGNGSGKTTLCRLIAGLRRPSSGAVLVDGFDPSQCDAPPSVGIAFQNPDSQFITASVEREILFGMENLSIEPAEMRRRLAGAGAAFGLEPFLRRNPHTLSGGEKQRLVLAGLRAMAPRHLVLDEPFSFLDAAGRRAFLEALRAGREGARETRETILWSTVDEGEIALADRVLFLHGGRIAYDGHPSRLGEAVPRDIVDASLVRAASDTLDRSDRGEKRGGERVGDNAGEGGTAAIEIRRAEFSPPGAAFVLPVSELSIVQGETALITGPSGSGKTTLLLGCAGLLPPRSGSATVLGRRIRSRRDAPVGRFAFLFQSPEQGFFAPTVREEVALAYRSLRGAAGLDEAVAAALERVGLSPASFLDRNPFALSQGEKRLVALASVLVAGAELVLLDEPTIFLDGAARARFSEVLRKLRAEGKTAVVASHDVRFFEPISDRIIPLSA